MRRSVAAPLWLLLLALVLVAIISAAAGIHRGRRSRQPFFSVAAASGPDTGVPFNGSFAPIVKKAIPSVVNISSSRIVQTPQVNPLFEDPFFKRFFGAIPRKEKEHSLGSGVVVSPDGYVLTNSHMVEGATDIEVSFGDKTQIPARIVGTDARTDLAVVKLDRSGLTPLPLADSSEVQVGDIALAIGDPFGIGRTVTMGIVSATSRGNLGIESEEDFIQTDAAINPGNSGGALINVRGELIGINTAILSPTGGNLGIGFAVPSNMARFAMEQISKSGKVIRGYLGIAVQALTPDLATQFGFNGSNGALISEVEAASPAERSGLKQGYIITAINGKPVTDARDLQLAISETAPGSTVNLSVFNDGRQQQMSVKVGEEPAQGKK
jgi:Do/DeqQ family serine protease